MAYITRNTSGEINAFYETQQSAQQEYVSIDDLELIEFIKLSASHTEAKSALTISDIELVRVLEDLINTLINKNVIHFTDLPLAAQSKLSNRENIRGHLTSLDNLMADDEGLL
jgi:hypothetical protein